MSPGQEIAAWLTSEYERLDVRSHKAECIKISERIDAAIYKAVAEARATWEMPTLFNRPTVDSANE